MKILIAPLIALVLALTGCAGTPAGDAIRAATSIASRPITAVDIYVVKNLYAVALTGLNEYEAYCWSKPYALLMRDPIAKPICQSRRPVLRAMKQQQAKAEVAVHAAESNPTLITAAWAAVNAFKATVPGSK